MNVFYYQLHLHASKKAGYSRSCEGKRQFPVENEALTAAQAHNRWPKRRHDVEPYPCAFCGKWHIGGKMPLVTLIKSYFKEEYSMEEEVTALIFQILAEVDDPSARHMFNEQGFWFDVQDYNGGKQIILDIFGPSGLLLHHYVLTIKEKM